PQEILRRTRRLRLPDAALLLAQSLPPATPAGAAGSLQPEHRRRLSLRQGSDLCPSQSRGRRADALPPAVRPARCALAKARSGRVSSSPCRCTHGAAAQARPGLRASYCAGLSKTHRGGVSRFLLLL